MPRQTTESRHYRKMSWPSRLSQDRWLQIKTRWVSPSCFIRVGKSSASCPWWWQYSGPCSRIKDCSFVAITPCLSWPTRWLMQEWAGWSVDSQSTNAWSKWRLARRTKKRSSRMKMVENFRSGWKKLKRTRWGRRWKRYPSIVRRRFSSTIASTTGSRPTCSTSTVWLFRARREATKERKKHFSRPYT